MTETFLSRFRRAISQNRLATRGDSILLAVSGGPDSLALLLAFHEIAETDGYRIAACVVNHRIRKEAAAEAAFVQKVCADLGVPCHAETVDVPMHRAEHGGSLETVARNLRYAALRRVAKAGGYDTIATAHHRGDQAETVLYHLIRGSGLCGLSGMQAIAGDLIRPFLGFSKADILRFLETYPYTPCHDESNDVPDAVRNKIRLEILPRLSEINSRVEEALCRLAESARTDENFLRAAAETYAARAEVVAGGIRMRREDFAAIPDALRYRALRLLWGKAGGRVPTTEDARRVAQFLLGKETGKVTDAAGVLVEMERGTFFLHRGDTRHYNRKQEKS